MVGFPGETEGRFCFHCSGGEAAAFAGYTYSLLPRPGTPAAGFPEQVPRWVKEDRSQRLISLGHQQP